MVLAVEIAAAEKAHSAQWLRKNRAYFGDAQELAEKLYENGLPLTWYGTWRMYSIRHLAALLSALLHNPLDLFAWPTQTPSHGAPVGETRDQGLIDAWARQVATLCTDEYRKLVAAALPLVDPENTSGALLKWLSRKAGEVQVFAASVLFLGIVVLRAPPPSWWWRM